MPASNTVMAECYLPPPLSLLLPPCGFTDLGAISEKLSSGYYTSCWLFLADMKRVFTNCRTYCDAYRTNPEWSKAANTLERYFNSRMKESGAWVDIGL